MDQEQFGRLMAFVERTHEDVLAIRANQDRQWQRLDEHSVELARHRVWVKVLTGVVGTVGATLLTAIGLSGLGGVVQRVLSGGP